MYEALWLTVKQLLPMQHYIVVKIMPVLEAVPESNKDTLE